MQNLPTIAFQIGSKGGVGSTCTTWQAQQFRGCACPTIPRFILSATGLIPFHMGQLGGISWCFMGDSGKVHHRRGRSKGVRRTLPFRKGPSCRPCLVMLMGKCCFASPSGKTSGDAITWLEPQVRSCFGQSPKKATGRGLSGISSACPRLFANHALGVLQVLIPQKAVALASPAELASAALSFFLLAAQKDRSLRRTLCLNSHGDGDSSPPWSDLLSLLLVFVDGFQLEHSGGWHSTDIDVKYLPPQMHGKRTVLQRIGLG